MGVLSGLPEPGSAPESDRNFIAELTAQTAVGRGTPSNMDDLRRDPDDRAVTRIVNLSTGGESRRDGA